MSPRLNIRIRVCFKFTHTELRLIFTFNHVISQILKERELALLNVSLSNSRF